MWWIIGLLVVVIFLGGLSGKKLADSKKKALDGFKENGFKIEYLTEPCKYISGHPEMDMPKSNIRLCPNNAGDISIIKETLRGSNWSMDSLNTIPSKMISDILVEDSSTVEKKVTAGRILALGLFAFAAKKKVNHELAYLTIVWNDGRFSHESIFEFQEQNALQKANRSRNQLIKALKS